MKEVILLDTNIREAYNNADAAGKKLLKNLVNDQVDFTEKITDRVKSFEDACKVLRLNPSAMLNGEELPDEAAYIKLKVIVKALNEGWTPDWNNIDEYKWWPWWCLGDGFRLYGVAYYCSDSTVSSRLCFKSRELAEYAAKQFIELYKDYMLVV